MPKCLIQIGAEDFGTSAEVSGHFGRHYNLVPNCPGAEVSRERLAWLIDHDHKLPA